MKISYRNLELSLFWPRFYKLPRSASPPKAIAVCLTISLKALNWETNTSFELNSSASSSFIKMFDLKTPHKLSNIFSLLIFYEVFCFCFLSVLKQWDRDESKNQFHQIIIKFIPSQRCYIRLFSTIRENTFQKVARKTTTKLRFILICNISMCGQNSSLVRWLMGRRIW